MVRECLDRLKQSSLDLSTLCSSSSGIDYLKASKSVFLKEELDKIIDYCVSSNVESWMLMDKTDETARDELRAAADPALAWTAEVFLKGVHSKFSAAPPRDCSGNERLHKKTCQLYIFDDTHDIEESIWCPILGLKGQMDVIASVKTAVTSTCECQVARQTYPRAVSSMLPKWTATGQLKIPLELKTGQFKASVIAGHRAQVVQY